jgi:hypothetical protein
MAACLLNAPAQGQWKRAKPDPAEPAAPKAAPAPAPPKAAAPVAKDVPHALSLATDYLYKTQKPDGSWATKYSSEHAVGGEALAASALLAAGQGPDNPKFALAMDYVAKFAPNTVYARAMRTMLYAQLDQGVYGKKLAEDVAWLIAQQKPTGGWGYGPAHRMTQAYDDWTDASNTQLALLAIQKAASAGAQVPPAFWKKAAGYWVKGQNPDGGWGYDPPKYRSGRPGSYGSMTAAGVASLLSLLDRQIQADPSPASYAAEAAAAQKGTKWLLDNYDVTTIPKWPLGQSDEHLAYYLHCLGRAIDAGGLGRTGGIDWKTDVTRQLLARQRADGSWGPAERSADAESETVVRTAFAMLCLAASAPPLGLQKLRLDEGWSGEFRDANRLSDYISASLKSPVKWRWLDGQSPESFDDAPVLLISGSGKFTPPGGFEAGVRSLLSAGGIILVAAGDREFAQAVTAALQTALPRHTPRKLPAEHSIFTTPAVIPAEMRPAVTALGDYVQTNVFVLTGEFASHWHANRVAAQEPAFAIVTNLIHHALGGTCAMPSPAATPERFASVSRVAVARLKHKADWDVCPGALREVSAVTASALSIAIAESAADLSADIDPTRVPLLWLTGCDDPKLTDAQLHKLKKYLAGGGVLFVDSAVGRGEFTAAVTRTLVKMFGPDCLKPMQPEHPVLTGEVGGGAGADVVTVELTPGASDKPSSPALSCVEIDGRAAVIVSKYGVTAPAAGKVPQDCLGVAPADARRLAANIVLYAIGQ